MVEMFYIKVWIVYDKIYLKVNVMCIFFIIKNYLIIKEIQKEYGFEGRNEG